MHTNQLVWLRLLLATAVIASHSSELIYGNRSHEPVTQLFHTMSLGEIAVSGFFVVSGFLVTQSYINGRSPFDYLRKRIFRIYPAFAVASLVCLIVVAPFSGSSPSSSISLLQTALRNIALLNLVTTPGAFHALHHPDLDGAMWSIRFEFRCYILVALLGLLGQLRRKYVILCITACLLLEHGWLTRSHYAVSVPHPWPYPIGFALFVDPISAIWLAGMFCTGISFYLFREQVKFSGYGALLCLLPLLLCLSVSSLSGPGFAVFGGYILLWFGLRDRFFWAPSMGSVDISYGLYLYAWPIMSLIILHVPSITPIPLGVVTWVLSVCMGYLSWHLIEKPALSWRRKMDRQEIGATSATSL
jgi:peptidoglycan/LPS O-acetylase OafA/YrhL